MSVCFLSTFIQCYLMAVYLSLVTNSSDPCKRAEGTRVNAMFSRRSRGCGWAPLSVERVSNFMAIFYFQGVAESRIKYDGR